MDGTVRSNIKIGSKVQVVQKQDQRTGKLTEGVVMRILTNSSNHPRGIKVMLEGGIVGRVQQRLQMQFILVHLLHVQKKNFQILIIQMYKNGVHILMER